MTPKIVASHTAPIDDTVSDLVDWIELKILESEFNAFNINELSSLTEEGEDEENENYSEQDLLNEDTVLTAIEEIVFRLEKLGDSYPFEMAADDTEVRLKQEDVNIGQWVYLYCLIISHRKSDGVNISDFDLSNEDRDILQIASVYAAAGHFGEAVSFGWPRKDGSKFLIAIKDTFSSMGEGTPRDSFLPGVNCHAKDGEIDIVAWTSMNDDLPGKLFLLGQVATGKNWKDKSILSAIQYVFDTYFSRSPVSEPIGAMFIPFCIDKQYEGSRHEVLQDLTSRFGIIYYRLRLPYYALIGFNRKEISTPREEESFKIKGFIQDTLGAELFNSTFPN